KPRLANAQQIERGVDHRNQPHAYEDNADAILCRCAEQVHEAATLTLPSACARQRVRTRPGVARPRFGWNRQHGPVACFWRTGLPPRLATGRRLAIRSYAARRFGLRRGRLVATWDKPCRNRRAGGAPHGSTVGAGLESLDLLAQKGQPFVHARVATARLSCLLGQA